MKISFTLLLCLLTFTAFAQNNFVKGYYITTQGDTIQSYIDDKNWVKKPDHIRIKTSPESSAVNHLSASDLKGFGLSTGDLFVSEIVQIDKSPVDVNQMVMGAAPIVVTDTVFLRVLVKGKLSLLYMEDEDAKQHFYVQQHQTQPEELVIVKKLVILDKKEYVSPLEVYKETLARVLHDCPDAAGKAYNTELQASSLTKLISKYNECFATATEQDYTAKKEKIKYKIGAVAGLMPTTLFLDSGEKAFKPTTDNYLKHYTMGISLDIILPRANGRWSVYNELAWKAFQVADENEYQLSPNHYQQEKLDVKVGYLGLNSLIRFRFPFKSLQPYINIGLANNYSFINENTKTTYSRHYSVEDTRKGKYMEEVKEYERALLLGAGVIKNKFSAEIRYENGEGISPYMTIHSARRTFKFLLGYTFN